jgi:site-specific DNA-methyltransferase (adenine-specific)
VTVQLFQGDCLTLLPELPDRSVDLVLVDPPHGRTQAAWDRLLPAEAIWEQYHRLLKPHGAVVMITTQPFTSAMVLSNLKGFRYQLIWEKSKATGWLNAKRRPMAAHEEILVFSPRAPRYFPQMRAGAPYNKGLTKAQVEGDIYGRHGQVVVASEGGRYPRSVLYFKTAEAEGPVYHKSQKPQSLLQYLIRTYSLPGECVLDNTMGVGSTGVAAAALGRHFIGIEQDPAFFARAQERLAETGAPLPDGVEEVNEH